METTIKKQANIWVRIFRFYRDGFCEMTLGRTLWKIIFIKLIIMFAVLKVFFFQDFLASHFTTDAERAAFVLEQLTPSVQLHNIALEAGDND